MEWWTWQWELESISLMNCFLSTCSLVFQEKRKKRWCFCASLHLCIGLKQRYMGYDHTEGYLSVQHTLHLDTVTVKKERESWRRHSGRRRRWDYDLNFLKNNLYSFHKDTNVLVSSSIFHFIWRFIRAHFSLYGVFPLIIRFVVKVGNQLVQPILIKRKQTISSRTHVHSCSSLILMTITRPLLGSGLVTGDKISRRIHLLRTKCEIRLPFLLLLLISFFFLDHCNLEIPNSDNRKFKSNDK